MKKSTCIFSLIIAILLIGCGSTASSGTSEAEAALSENAATADITDELTQSLSDSKDENAVTTSYSEEKNVNEDKNENGVSEENGSNDNNSDIATGTETESSDSLPEYTVTEFEEIKTMYASDPVNVRQGPSTDFEIVSFLGRGQEVSVTGQADTEWYEIICGEDKAFVSNKYLQDEMPTNESVAEENSEQNTETASAQNSESNSTTEDTAQQSEEPQPVTEVKNVAGVILVGDSRFVQMQNSVGENSCTWIAESGKGYNWFSEKAIPRIDSCVGKGSKILINLGVNDTGNLQKYISLVNAKADEWVGKGAAVYYSSVNPVWENPYVNEEQVEYFNSQMKSSLNSNVHWIDSHSYLNSVGYRLVDGLHYSTETYQTLYAYYMNCL